MYLFLAIIVSVIISVPLANAGETAPSLSSYKIVAFGDSITKGVRPAKDGVPEVVESDTFVFLLKDTVGEYFSSIDIINSGIGGDHTSQALPRLKRDVLSHDPDVVLIMFGTNDSCWNHGATRPLVSLDTYEKNLREIIKQIRDIGAKPVLMTPTPLGKGWGAKRNDIYVEQGDNGPISQYAESCREIADELAIPLIDHFQQWQAEPDGKIERRTTDRCHPNAIGHKVIAESIASILIQTLNSPEL